MVASPSMMIVAGEASADLHGAELLAELERKRPDVRAFGVGGQSMRAQKFEALVPAESMSLAGLTEVLMGLPRMWRIMRQLVRAAREIKPSVVVLIDLPDFNLRLAKRLKKLGIPVIYYISPQLWAWRQKRVEQIRKHVDQMLVILPFEKDFYDQHGIEVEFVGHPLVEELPEHTDQAAARHSLGLPNNGPVVALLPGSRRKEVSRHLPIMLESMKMLRDDFPEAIPVIPVASTIPRELIESCLRNASVDARVVTGQAVDVVTAADAAVVCSGTSTLQTALLSRPMVVVYKVSWLTFAILKRLVNVAHIALVNLIAGRRLVPELVQDAFTPANVKLELSRLLNDDALRNELKREFASIRQQLGQGGVARKVVIAINRYLPEQEPPTH